MIPRWPGAVVQNWGCCTQGIILARQQVPGLMANLKRRAGEDAADIIVMDYATSMGLDRYVLNPVQAQHMGFAKSVISAGRTEDGYMWSTAFEDLNPIRLAREHAQMVMRLYGTIAR